MPARPAGKESQKARSAIIIENPSVLIGLLDQHLASAMVKNLLADSNKFIAAPDVFECLSAGDEWTFGQYPSQIVKCSPYPALWNSVASFARQHGGAWGVNRKDKTHGNLTFARYNSRPISRE